MPKTKALVICFEIFKETEFESILEAFNICLMFELLQYL